MYYATINSVRIGIDISQTVYEKTGVANYLQSLIKELLNIDKNNEYVLFYSSFRRRLDPQFLQFISRKSNVKIKRYPFSPRILDILWNRLHILSIERFIGDVDVFISSDWTQPPSIKAKLVTIIYDLIVFTFPKETDLLIVNTQKRRLQWVKKECSQLLCISEATRKDAIRILGITEDKVTVIYPGI